MRGREQSAGYIRHMLCAILFVVSLMFIGNVSVQAATKYKVTFYENNGVTNSTFQKLTKTVQKGKAIELPTLTPPKGFVNLGWTTTKGATNPFYKNGEKYTVTKDTKFYLVQRKLYDVSFVNMNGTSNSFFAGLKKSIRHGKTITLPDSIPKTGYTFLGWSKKKNSTKAEFAVGTVYQVKAATKFYAVYRKSVVVTYLSNDGLTVYKKVSWPQGEKFVISGRSNSEGYTFLGWSETAFSSTNPTYLVGRTITVDRSLNLYAVQYQKSKEYNYTEANIPEINRGKFDKVIFVGDSRTYRAEQTLQKQISLSEWKYSRFVAKGGATLNWFDEVGYQWLVSEVGKGGTSKKPIAIVFNLGVNDMERLTQYIARMKQIEPYFSKRHCKLFYMSVNPVNNVILQNQHLKNRPEKQLLNFNKAIQSQLCASGKFTYIDSFSYLMKTGYAFDAGRGVDTGIDDGLHYTTKTYKKIYAYVIKTLNAL